MIRRTLTAVLAMAAMVAVASPAVAAPAGDFVWPPSDVKPVHKNVEQLRAQAEGFSERQRTRVPSS